MRSKRGATLVEISLASAIFGLLLAATFYIFRCGSLAWSRSDVSLDLLQELRTVTVRWNNEFAETSPDTVLVSGATVSFASARNQQASFTSSAPMLRPLWQKFVLYYWDSSSQTLRRRELPLTSPNSTLKTLVDCDFGSGPQPLATYTSGGETLLKDVTNTNFVLNGRVCTVNIDTRRPTYGSLQGQTISLQASSRCGN
ncbi:MAG: prepilin-type N-terminal cleavage/methylation domain-containing protein [Candidatus Eremiobacteraeota bacterium]|nr:prepilin-type N-terminal cleavage/methylation domain-containing protein [Candidatus Eremiobacteraeota bacterium]MCW5868714.1 prepilin-type N-terminal cleavage/methylation domain-containing protein [Candidatus Eremiobacteraeota bacterium]